MKNSILQNACIPIFRKMGSVRNVKGERFLQTTDATHSFFISKKEDSVIAWLLAIEKRL